MHCCGSVSLRRVPCWVVSIAGASEAGLKAAIAALEIDGTEAVVAESTAVEVAALLVVGTFGRIGFDVLREAEETVAVVVVEDSQQNYCYRIHFELTGTVT